MGTPCVGPAEKGLVSASWWWTLALNMLGIKWNTEVGWKGSVNASSHVSFLDAYPLVNQPNLAVVPYFFFCMNLSKCQKTVDLKDLTDQWLNFWASGPRSSCRKGGRRHRNLKPNQGMNLSLPTGGLSRNELEQPWVKDSKNIQKRRRNFCRATGTYISRKPGSWRAFQQVKQSARSPFPGT